MGSEDLTKLTAEELRAKAKECYARADESWDRSGADGFLSQWASKKTARLYEDAADLADQNWTAEFPILVNARGEKIKAWLNQGDHGLYWKLADDEAAKYGRKFIPFAGEHVKNPRVQRKLGLHEESESAPATVELRGNGVSMYPVTVRR